MYFVVNKKSVQEFISIAEDCAFVVNKFSNVYDIKDLDVMISFKYFTLILFGVLTFVPVAVSSQNYYKGGGDVLFISEAPLEVIKAESSQLEGVIDLDKMKFAFKIKVNTFDGFNSSLQKDHFNEHYLETDLYPEATFTGSIILDEPCLSNCSSSGIFKGKFTIHNESKIEVIPVSFKIKADTVFISSQFNVLLSDFNIKIPRIVQSKISPDIDVVVELELNKI